MIRSVATGVGRLLRNHASWLYQRVRLPAKVLKVECKSDARFLQNLGYYLFPTDYFCRQTFRGVLPGKIEPGSRGRLCFFAHYDPDRLIAPYVAHFVRELEKAKCEVVFITGCGKLAPAEIAKIAPHCSKIVFRANVGRDFAHWRAGMSVVPHVSEYDEVLLVNDSVFGPLYRLDQVFERMRDCPLDLWGITDSYDPEYHIQSYFLLFTRRALRGSFFRSFWRGYRPCVDKKLGIHEYEIGTTRAAKGSGLRTGAFCEYRDVEEYVLREHPDHYARDLLRDGPRNPGHYFWNQLVVGKECPFIKIEVFSQNPTRNPDLGTWEDVVAKYPTFDRSMIAEQLKRIRSYGKEGWRNIRR